MPAIIAFLGYNPLPEAKTLAERLVRRRTTLGMSQKEAAARIGVDPATSARWQRRERRADGRDGSAEWKDLSLITGRSGRTRATLCTT